MNTLAERLSCVIAEAFRPVRELMRYRGAYTPPAITPEETRSVLAILESHFGRTQNPREAGYLLPDGGMLDLSGRHYGTKPRPGERDFYANQRAVDHRDYPEEIYDRYRHLLGDDDYRGDSATPLMFWVMGSGVVRFSLHGEAWIHFVVLPTDAQRRLLERMVSSGADGIRAILSDPASAETLYESSGPAHVGLLRRSLTEATEVAAGRLTPQTVEWV